MTLSEYISITRLCALRAHAEAILASCIPWDGKYRLIFSAAVSQRMLALILMSAPDFTWHDPDMDYEDDVRAFLVAVDAHIQQVQHKMRELDIGSAYSLFHEAAVSLESN